MFTQRMHLINIVAMSTNGVIGVDNRLPWKSPSDLKEFCRSIKGKKLVMGRKTCESLPRKQNSEVNFVLTSDKDFYKEGYVTINSLYDLQNYVEPNETIYVIGGGTLYNLVLDLKDDPMVNVINEVTIVDIHVDTNQPHVVKFPINRLNKDYDRANLRYGQDEHVTWSKYLYYRN